MAAMAGLDRAGARKDRGWCDVRRRCARVSLVEGDVVDLDARARTSHVGLLHLRDGGARGRRESQEAGARDGRCVRVSA
eukprot:6198235-Pleurochrysis_carterae.AAC.1